LRSPPYTRAAPTSRPGSLPPGRTRSSRWPSRRTSLMSPMGTRDYVPSEVVEWGRGFPHGPRLCTGSS